MLVSHYQRVTNLGWCLGLGPRKEQNQYEKARFLGRCWSGGKGFCANKNKNKNKNKNNNNNNNNTKQQQQQQEQEQELRTRTKNKKKKRRRRRRRARARAKNNKNKNKNKNKDDDFRICNWWVEQQNANKWSVFYRGISSSGTDVFEHIEHTNHDSSRSKLRGVQPTHMDIERIIPVAISFNANQQSDDSGLLLGKPKRSSTHWQGFCYTHYVRNPYRQKRAGGMTVPH